MLGLVLAIARTNILLKESLYLQLQLNEIHKNAYSRILSGLRIKVSII